MRRVISRRRLIAGLSTAAGLAALDHLAAAPAAAAELPADGALSDSTLSDNTSSDGTSSDDSEIKESDKTSQAEAHYQPRPNGQQRCEICLQFLPPGHCRIVRAPITAQGWCQYFAARDNAT